ncbi:hypothetical protein XENOCAPTIV_011888 [Xenoophorus captivus]|uniref:Uncharacterized protein n=1 Tax=Xenoophorus captivus TaxID=1517983 RepID=A0ABV0SHW3_9TELE
MHLQKEGQDPVPAFKSWQDDTESGEAQLSPLAGRMVPLPPLPLEDDGEEEMEGRQDDSPSSSRSHPHILTRRFLDFGAHSTQRFLQQDLEATSPSKAQRYEENQRSWINLFSPLECFRFIIPFPVKHTSID